MGEPKREAPGPAPPAGATNREDGPAKGPASSATGEPRGPADQLGAILNKGLDLAEASLGLGLTVLNRVGAVAEHELLERFTVKAPRDGPAPPESAPSAAPPRPSAEGTPAPSAEEQLYCIVNRTPLLPGATVKVSFSINNDSLTAPKKVTLRIEGLLGESEGTRLEVQGFAVKPARSTIAPMDFEKFVLHGAVPPEAPPDVYRGWIVVSAGEEEFRIPVRLAVGP